MLNERRFYRPVPDDRRHDWSKISGYDLGGYDIVQWWRGNPLQKGISSDRVKLYLKNGIATDYVPNPLSLQSCSDRLSEHFHIAAPTDIQLFDAPLLNATTHEAVSGYKLLNVVQRVSCLDYSKSVVSYRDDRPGQISGIPRLVVDSLRVPPSVRIFRLEESFPVLLISQEVFDIIYASGVKGMAFLECEISTSASAVG